MTYSSRENSVALGEVIELYQFIIGTEFFLFASCAQPITYLAKEYSPSSISRDAVKQGVDPFKGGLSVRFPKSDSFAQQFITFAPNEVVSLTIFRGHFGDPEFVTYWKGRVLGGSISGQEISLDCESVFSSLKRPGLRATHEINCRHVVYSIQCKASAAAMEVTGTVNSTSNGETTLQVASAATKPDGWFTAGFLVIGGVRRFIKAHQGINLTISRPFGFNVITSPIRMYAGCDHLLSTCNTKFNNGDNHGGFPFIPGINPFGGSSII